MFYQAPVFFAGRSRTAVHRNELPVAFALQPDGIQHIAVFGVQTDIHIGSRKKVKAVFSVGIRSLDRDPAVIGLLHRDAVC